MRKSLVVLLAFAMVFTMFNAVVFAAEEPSSLDRLKTAGVIEGTPSGDTMDDRALLRQDAAVLAARMHGAVEEAVATEKSHTYADVTDGEFYDGYLSWALENGLMQGHSTTNFGYNEPINNQQFLTVLLRAIEIDDFENAVERALEEGIIAEAVEADEEIIRSDVYEYIVNTLDIADENGDTLGHRLGLEGWVVEAPEISAQVVDVDEIEINFSTAVDPELEIELKSGLVPYTTENTWNDANTTVTLKGQFAFPGGDYTVSVEGYDDIELEIEDEKAVSLKINNQALENVDNAKLGVTLTNQYDKEMDLNRADFVITAYSTTKGPLIVNPNEFEINVENVAPNQSAVGDQVVVTVVYKDLTQTVTLPVIAKTAISSFVFTGFEPADEDDERVYVNKDGKINYQLVNQYGDAITLEANQGKDLGGATSLATTRTFADVTFISTNSNVIDLRTLYTDGDGNLFFTAGAAKGETKLTALVPSTGSTHSIDIQIAETAGIETFKISLPASIIPAEEDVEFPYTALDQFGVPIEAKDVDITGVVTFSSSNPAVISDTDFSMTDGKLNLNASGSGTATVFVWVNGTELQQQINITVRDKAEAKRITGVKDLPLLIEEGASTKALVVKDNLIVVDQYNRVMEDYDEAVDIEITTNGSVTEAAGVFTGVDADETAESVTFTLLDGTDKVSGSAYKVTIGAIKSADIKSYELAEVPTLHAPDPANADYDRDLKLTGKSANGTLVQLVDNKINHATSSDETIATVVEAGGVATVTGVKKGTAKIAVWNGATKLAEVEVTVSEDAPVPTSVKFTKDSEDVAVNDDLKTLLEIKDQYGEELDSAGGFWTSDSANVEISNVGVITGGTGGEATIGYISKNGVSATIKVTL